MRVTRDEIIDSKNLVDHFVLEGVASHPDVAEALMATGCAEVRVTVNGKEVDLKAFVKHWESQVGRMIQDQALKQVQERLAKFEAITEDVRAKLANEGLIDPEPQW
jgi:hypothetical protein